MIKKVWMCFLLLFLVGCSSKETSKQAQLRAEEFAEAVNYSYEEPEKIYALLANGCTDILTEEAFCQAFSKERSYPYLTPLFLNSPETHMQEDNKSGTVTYSQAARLPGMEYEVELVFEDDDYYIMAFAELLDGSYLDKFQDIPYSLDSYFHAGTVGNGR